MILLQANGTLVLVDEKVHTLAPLKTDQDGLIPVRVGMVRCTVNSDKQLTAEEHTALVEFTKLRQEAKKKAGG